MKVETGERRDLQRGKEKGEAMRLRWSEDLISMNETPSYV